MDKIEVIQPSDESIEFLKGQLEHLSKHFARIARNLNIEPGKYESRQLIQEIDSKIQELTYFKRTSHWSGR